MKMQGSNQNLKKVNVKVENWDILIVAFPEINN